MEKASSMQALLNSSRGIRTTLLKSFVWCWSLRRPSDLVSLNWPNLCSLPQRTPSSHLREAPRKLPLASNAHLKRKQWVEVLQKLLPPASQSRTRTRKFQRLFRSIILVSEQMKMPPLQMVEAWIEDMSVGRQWIPRIVRWSVKYKKIHSKTWWHKVSYLGSTPSRTISCSIWPTICSGLSLEETRLVDYLWRDLNTRSSLSGVSLPSTGASSLVTSPLFTSMEVAKVRIL